MQVSPVLTDMRCEEKGCLEKAKWRVSLGKTMYFWCVRHTREHMANIDVWLATRERQTKTRWP